MLSGLHEGATMVSLEAPGDAPCSDLPLTARPLRVIPLESCSQPGCGCQGHGALLLAVGWPDVSWRGASCLPQPPGCIARRPFRSSSVRGVPAVSLLWRGRAILELSSPRGAKPALASVRFDLATFDLSALSLACSDQQWQIAAWHQPPRLDPEEAAINALLPPHLTSAPPGTIDSNPPILIVQQDGSILSGLLARYFLRQLRRHFAERSQASDSTHSALTSDTRAPGVARGSSAQMAGQARSR